MKFACQDPFTGACDAEARLADLDPNVDDWYLFRTFASQNVGGLFQEFQLHRDFQGSCGEML